jgi:hypothetical protein
MVAVSEQQPSRQRPPHLTAACLVVMLGSVFVVLLMWDRIANLHDLPTRRALEDFLDRSDLRGSGVGVGGLVTTVKVLSMVSAACAVAMAVQGWQATRRSRSARLALSVLVVPLFVTGLVGDGLVGSAAATFWCSGVAAAVLTLWLGPNRVWFGDPAPAPRSAPPSPLRRGAGPPPAPRPTDRPPDRPDTGQQPGQQPPPSPFPFGAARPPTQTVAPPPWAPPPTSAYDERRGRGPAGRGARRPRALLWACVLTWVCTGLASGGLVLSLAKMRHDSDSVVDGLYRRDPQLAEQGLSRHSVLAMLYALSAIVLLAAVAAAVFAILVFLRHHWAWYALVVSASAATLLFLVGSFGSPAAIVLLGACVATIACLVRPEVRSWLSG